MVTISRFLEKVVPSLGNVRYIFLKLCMATLFKCICFLRQTEYEFQPIQERNVKQRNKT